MLDPHSPIAPARVQVLLLPIGRIKRARFLSFVKRLQPENVVQLGDISPDGRPNRNMFSSLAFPLGRIVYDLRTTLPPESHRALSPFETFREPLAIIGLADGIELGHISYSSLGQQSKRDSLTAEERDIRQLYQELEHVRDQYPKALVHRLLMFDYVHNSSAAKLPEGLVSIPSPAASRTTTIKTVMCDISSMMLAEMTTLAKSIQGMSTVESPAQLQNGRDSWSNSHTENLVRRNSQFTNYSTRDSSPSTGRDRSQVRMSMPAQLRSTLSDSRASSTRPMTPTNGTQTPPTTFEAIAAMGSPEQRIPEKGIPLIPSSSSSRDSSRDRVSIQGFGAGSISERSRNKGKGRVAVVIGSLYLHAGRWGDAQRELVEGALAARSNNDHLWHAKALENILASMLMLAWTGLDFQIPQVCYAAAEKSTSTAEQKSTASNRLVSLQNLAVLLPELIDRILRLYQRSANFAGESLPQFCFSETVLRFSKLTSAIHLAGGKIDDEVLELVVQGTPFSHQPNVNQPRLNIQPKRTEIATTLFQAFPSFSSKEDLSVIDRTIVLGGIASVLGSLGYHRKKAMVMRELVSVLIPGLVQARKIGAAEMGVHPAAGLTALNAINGQSSGAGALDLGESDIETGIGDFLDMLCRVYGVVGFRPYSESKGLRSDPNSHDSVTSDDSDETILARALQNAETRSFGGQELKMNVLRACISLCEALPDFQGVLKFTTDLLRTVGSGIAPGSRGENAAPMMTRDEQVRLATNISRTIGAGEKLGLKNLEAEYWDEFLVRGIELENLPPLCVPYPHRKSELDGGPITKDSVQKNPFIYNPFLKKPDAAVVDRLLVTGEQALFKVTLQNPFEFELEIESIKVESEGIRFISDPQVTIIGPYRTQIFNVAGVPESSGSVVITGCLVKIRGCRERRFPIFSDPWIPQRALKIKAIGLKSTQNQFTSAKSNLEKTFPGITPPKVSSLKLNVIERQPMIVITSTTIKQSAIMVLEGEKQTFSITLQNVSEDTPVNLLLFSFQDSTQRKTLDAMTTKDTSPADLYELQFIASQREAFRWVKDTDSEPYIPPGGTATFTVEILGKPGLTNGVVQINYTHLKVPAADVEGLFYTRQVSLPLAVTVNASVELARMDILPLSSNVPKQLWSRTSSTLSQELRDADYCLLLLDLRNAWPVCLRVQISVYDSYLMTEDILPGNMTRVIVPVRRIYLKTPYAAVPSLDPARQRQFVVSANKMTAEIEQLAREAFWYREELLKIIRGSWQTTTGSLRKGNIELRGIRLAPRMIEALKVEDVEIGMKTVDDNSISKTAIGTDETQNLKITIRNHSPNPIHPLLRLQPSLRHQHPNVCLDLTKKLMWTGVLQQTLPILPANEATEVTIGFTALCRGNFEIGASVEEVCLSDDEQDDVEDAGKKKEKAKLRALRDELYDDRRRRIWHLRVPYVLEVRNS